jgi:hypothetical protein
MQAGQLREEALDDETARPVLSTLGAMQSKRAASLPLGKPHASRSFMSGNHNVVQRWRFFALEAALANPNSGLN